MAKQPKLPWKVRFTMLEPMAPLNPSPEELASRRVEISHRQPVTMLEPCAPLNPSPEELATRVVEPLINGAPVLPEPAAAVPPAVQALLTQLAETIDALTPKERAAAISGVAELTKRLAG